MPKVLTFVDLLIERTQREEKYFKNYLQYAKEIKAAAEEVLSKLKVYVFGSILRNDKVVRDIDILIIAPELDDPEKRADILASIWRKIGTLHPFEIHLITPEQYSGWYKYFIKKKIKI